MVEVPSLLWQLDELMAAVDFVSVGSNDLFQFIMAADRGNGQVSGRFDPLSPAFLRVLRQIVEAGEKNHTPVTLCGEMAGRPLTAMALIGARLPFDFDGARLDRTGQGDACRARRRDALHDRLVRGDRQDVIRPTAPRDLLHQFAAESGIPL